MNETISPERGILRRQIRDDVLNHFRSQAASNPQLSAADFLIRGLVCRLKAVGATTAEEIAEKIYRLNPVAQTILTDAMRSEPERLARAAVNPAMTSVAGWASELVGVANTACCRRWCRSRPTRNWRRGACGCAGGARARAISSVEIETGL